MEEVVWEVEEKSVIKYGDIIREVEGEITAKDIKNFAREQGIKRFIVKDEEGNVLREEDFPRTGVIVIEEYNEAKDTDDEELFRRFERVARDMVQRNARNAMDFLRMLSELEE